jgi:hypothetical protein
MKQAGIIAKAFPGFGNPLLLDIDDFGKALSNASG